MQVYASGIPDIKKFGKKLEIKYKRDKKESLSIAEDDVKFGLFQLDANPEEFDLHLETDSMEIRISGVDYKSLEKLKKVIKNVKK